LPVPKENAVLTSFASARISAPVDDVFAALLNYKNYSKWSCQQYTWQANIDGDGAPPVGTKGSFKVCSNLFDIMLHIYRFGSFSALESFRFLEIHHQVIRNS
jgi:hypothetical protein